MFLLCVNVRVGRLVVGKEGIEVGCRV
jgi:hypothetical protein